MKHADSYNSYEYLLEHLYSNPRHYEESFQRIRPYLYILRSFGTLKHLLKFVSDNSQDIRQDIAKDLKALARIYPFLKPQITELLMFVLWEDLRDKYGRDDGFSEGYWDLINEL